MLPVSFRHHFAGCCPVIFLNFSVHLGAILSEILHERYHYARCTTLRSHKITR